VRLLNARAVKGFDIFPRQFGQKPQASRRVGEGGTGMSFTEFAYMVLQALDYRELYDRHSCRLQIGGSDQWGNITAGLDLLRRTGRHGAFALTSPLILRSDGRKFGKTEEGAVWLDPERTSPFAFYQYFLNLPDGDVGSMLRRLSLRSREEIEALEQAVADAPQERAAQRALAHELTEMVHGPDGVAQAEEVSAWLFGGRELSSLRGDRLTRALRGGPVVSWGPWETWEQVAIDAGLASSVSDARRTIAGGGLWWDDQRVSEELPLPSPEGLRESGAVILRKGKRNRVVIVPG
jgi:tyrosyl-tRNA synthetase